MNSGLRSGRRCVTWGSFLISEMRLTRTLQSKSQQITGRAHCRKVTSLYDNCNVRNSVSLNCFKGFEKKFGFASCPAFGLLNQFGCCCFYDNRHPSFDIAKQTIASKFSAYVSLLTRETDLPSLAYTLEFNVEEIKVKLLDRVRMCVCVCVCTDIGTYGQF